MKLELHMLFAATAILASALTVQGSVDPFAFFGPTVVLSREDRQKLDERGVLARTVPAQDRQLAVFAVVQVQVDGDRLVSWVREIAQLKKSQYVLGIARFSDPPRLDDLAGLTLGDDDLNAIRKCRPGDCGLKLSDAEIAQLRRTVDEAKSDWKPAVQAAFRRIVLSRVEAYRKDGHTGLQPYHDHKRPVAPSTAFASIVGDSRFMSERIPAFAGHLTGYPHDGMSRVESFLYWSQERLGSTPVVSVTHVSIFRPEQPGLPGVVIASKQVFATHYMNGSLALTAIMPGPGSMHYLAYLNRSEVDVLGGIFGGLVRMILERRLKTEAVEVLSGLRRKLESGYPKPSNPSTR